MQYTQFGCAQLDVIFQHVCAAAHLTQLHHCLENNNTASISLGSVSTSVGGGYEPAPSCTSSQKRSTIIQCNCTLTNNSSINNLIQWSDHVNSNHSIQ